MGLVVEYILLIILMVGFVEKMSTGDDSPLLIADVQLCPERCVCTPSDTSTATFKSIICTCKNEIDHQRATPFAPLNTLPLGGDYKDAETIMQEKYYRPDIRAPSSHLELTEETFYAWGAALIVGRIVVHGCERVIVTKWAFRNVSINEQLNFVNIRSLSIQAHAFAGLTRSPAQLVIQDSGVDVLAPHAFASLSHVEHFWWRNVTIAKISRLAFFKLSNVGYLYFRNVYVNIIENGAFAHLRYVRHFFMRQNVRLEQVGDFFLLGSKVEEFVFEDVHINASRLAFVGLNARRVSLRNCTWVTWTSDSKHGSRQHNRIPYQRVVEFHALNSTIQSVSLANFYNFTIIRFENSQIDDIQGSDSSLFEQFHKLAVFNAAELNFRMCRILRWLSHALSDGRALRTLTLADSRIHFLARSAIHNTHVHQFHIAETQFRSISAHAFSHNKISHLNLNNVEVGALSDAVFYRSRFSKISLQNSKIRFADQRAYADIHACDHFEIAFCTFGNFPEKIFENSNITEVSIHDSKFEGTFIATAFEHLHANSLRVSHSEFECVLDACENNALLLHKTIHHNVAWMFSNNKCVPQLASRYEAASTITESNERGDNSNTEYSPFLQVKYNAQSDEAQDDEILRSICSEEIETVSEFANLGLVCRRRVLIEECVCIETPYNSNTPYEFVRLPDTKAKILLVGDCRHLLAHRSSSNSIDNEEDNSQSLQNMSKMQSGEGRANLEFLYLYRIDSLQLDANFDKMLKQVNVMYSTMNFSSHEVSELQKTTNHEKAKLDKIVITGSVVETIGSFAFEHLQSLNALIFNRTIVQGVNTHAFSHSNVRRVELWYSDLLNVGDMLEQVDEIRVEQSRIPHGKEVEKIYAQKLGKSPNNARNVLMPYELCILQSTHPTERLKCQKCFEDENCDEFNSTRRPEMKNEAPITKRCAGKNSKDCNEEVFIENVGDIAGVDVSLVSAASSLVLPKCVLIFILRVFIF